MKEDREMLRKKVIELKQELLKFQGRSSYLYNLEISNMNDPNEVIASQKLRLMEKTMEQERNKMLARCQMAEESLQVK
jgi:hypothetical protein